jgi:FHS family Na+ dependent glucose MFS transporter 1
MGTSFAVLSPAQRTRATVGYYLAFLPLGLGTAVLGPTLNDLVQATATDWGWIGVLPTALSVGSILGSLLGGRCCDHLPGHGVLASALLLTMLTFGLVPLISWLAVLSAVVLLLGLALGVVDVGANTLLLWIHEGKVGPWMNGLHASFGVGTVLAPLVVGIVFSLGGDLTWVYRVIAVLVLPGVVWLAPLPSPPIRSTPKIAPEGPTPRPLVLRIMLFLGLYVGAEIGFGYWVATYAVSMKLSSGKAAAAYLTMAFWIGLTLGRLVAVPLAARFRPQMILLADLAGCLVTVGLLLVWPSSVPVLWLATLGLGLSMASIFPTTMDLAARYLKMTGRMTSGFIVGGYAGSMTLPWLVGLLLETYGPWVVPVTLLVDLLLATVVLVSLMAQRGVGGAHSNPPVGGIAH